MKILTFYLVVGLVAVSGCSSNKLKSEKSIQLIHEAETQYKRGMLTESEATFRRVIDTSPSYYDAWLKLGNIYVRTGQLEAAIESYGRCTQLDPENVRCWNNLSLARVKQAMATLESGKKRFPEGSPEYNNLLSFYGRLMRTLTVN